MFRARNQRPSLACIVPSFLYSLHLTILAEPISILVVKKIEKAKVSLRYHLKFHVIELMDSQRFSLISVFIMHPNGT